MFYHGPEVLVGGGYYAGVKAVHLTTADGGESFLLKGAKQLCLKCRGQFAYVGEVQSALIGVIQFSGHVAAILAAEKLLLEDFLVQRCAVYHYKALTLIFVMQRLSYRHLAGAAFARYKHAYIYVTEFFYHLQKTPQGRAGAYEFV